MAQNTLYGLGSKPTSTHVRCHFIWFVFLISLLLYLATWVCDWPCAWWCGLGKRQDGSRVVLCACQAKIYHISQGLANSSAAKNQTPVHLIKRNNLQFSGHRTAKLKSNLPGRDTPHLQESAKIQEKKKKRRNTKTDVIMFKKSKGQFLPNHVPCKSFQQWLEWEACGVCASCWEWAHTFMKPMTYIIDAPLFPL